MWSPGGHFLEAISGLSLDSERERQIGRDRDRGRDRETETNKKGKLKRYKDTERQREKHRDMERWRHRVNHTQENCRARRSPDRWPADVPVHSHIWPGPGFQHVQPASPCSSVHLPIKGEKSPIRLPRQLLICLRGYGWEQAGLWAAASVLAANLPSCIL